MIPQERSNDEAELSPLMAFSPMALHVHRAIGPVVGRPVELTAIEQELASAGTGRLVGLTVEGEPGIGKTRLLLAARERPNGRRLHGDRRHGRRGAPGPFLVARSILGSPEAVAAATAARDRRGARPLPGLDVGPGRSRARERCPPIAGCSARSTWAPSRSAPSPPNGRSPS